MKHPRRGVSLAELLVVMIACLAVVSLSSQLICRVMRAQLDSRRHADVERSALRLSRQFRSDVHRATNAELAAAGSEDRVTLEFPDGEVAEYLCDDHAIERRTMRGGERISVEEYRFPETIACDVNQFYDPPRLQLSALAAPTPIPALAASPSEKSLVTSPSNPIYLQVEAVLGRDLRMAPAAQSVEEAE